MHGFDYKMAKMNGDVPNSNGTSPSSLQKTESNKRDVEPSSHFMTNSTDRSGTPKIHSSRERHGINGDVPTPHEYEEPLKPIAIVGMAFRFPGDAVTEDAFWDMLLQKRCASSEFPADRMNIDAFHCPDGKRPNTVCHNLPSEFLSSLICF